MLFQVMYISKRSDCRHFWHLLQGLRLCGALKHHTSWMRSCHIELSQQNTNMTTLLQHGRFLMSWLCTYAQKRDQFVYGRHLYVKNCSQNSQSRTLCLNRVITSLPSLSKHLDCSNNLQIMLCRNFVADPVYWLIPAFENFSTVDNGTVDINLRFQTIFYSKWNSMILFWSSRTLQRRR